MNTLNITYVDDKQREFNVLRTTITSAKYGVEGHGIFGFGWSWENGVGSSSDFWGLAYSKTDLGTLERTITPEKYIAEFMITLLETFGVDYVHQMENREIYFLYGPDDRHRPVGIVRISDTNKCLIFKDFFKPYGLN